MGNIAFMDLKIPSKLLARNAACRRFFFKNGGGVVKIVGGGDVIGVRSGDFAD